MPRIRNISGKKLIKIFESFGFNIVSQKGSHVKMRRAHEGSTQVLVVPNHIAISKGTLREIYNQALNYLPEKEIKDLFYL
jgi:predicted RNA binding protein YcfA (HicA-like mRNA interferase family)